MAYRTDFSETKGVPAGLILTVATLIMVGIGVLYLAYLLIRRGWHGMTMPDMIDVDKAMDAGTVPVGAAEH